MTGFVLTTIRAAALECSARWPRTAFREKEAESSAEETDRWLKVCYLEADAIQDRRRVLDAQLEEATAEA